MVLIPVAEFLAGEPDSLKGMVVSEFYIDKYEVTQREFEHVLGNHPSLFFMVVQTVLWIVLHGMRQMNIAGRLVRDFLQNGVCSEVWDT